MYSCNFLDFVLYCIPYFFNVSFMEKSLYLSLGKQYIYQNFFKHYTKTILKRQALIASGTEARNSSITASTLGASPSLL